MDTSIFVDWYNTVFIPEVKKQQIQTRSTGNVSLLVNNAPSHPSLLSLEIENGKFKLVVLPPNVTSVVQPMNQGVIESVKRYYRKSLLSMTLLGHDEDKTILQIYKAINMKDAVYMAAEAWDCVKETTLKKACNKLSPTLTAPTPQEPPNQFVSELVGLINQSPAFEECDDGNIHEWLECDVDDPEYELMTVGDIIA